MSRLREDVRGSRANVSRLNPSLNVSAFISLAVCGVAVRGIAFPASRATASAGAAEPIFQRKLCENISRSLNKVARAPKQALDVNRCTSVMPRAR